LTTRVLPPKDNSRLLQEILDELIARNPEILSALVISNDGLNVASGTPQKDDDTVAVTASGLMDTATEFCAKLEQGRLLRVVLEGEQRTTIVVNAGKHTVLAVLIPAEVKLGLVALSMRHAAEKVAAIFD
jgi:predicted regulator of Ras-like GTPase activity (Roadblock/LC7/MglB family)